jgi:N-acetylglucosaminyldiphosphoundecaprenol N-acetyl-beta-D-mannosaminyltransferase
MGSIETSLPAAPARPEPAARRTSDAGVQRFNVLGIKVSAVTPDTAVRELHRHVEESRPTYVCVSGVHGVIESLGDETLRAIHNDAGIVTPDGMPLVWVGRLLGIDGIDRVYGPDLMLNVCRHGLAHGYRHYFYGGGPGVAEQLARCLQAHFAGLSVAGTYSPPFGEISAALDDEIVERINAARPHIVWVGLSTPKQERWMASHRSRLTAPVLAGVGAAFDFNAGLKKQAPAWMQRRGLEWLFRLLTEPRRLWRRYLRVNPLFLYHITLQLSGLRRY